MLFGSDREAQNGEAVQMLRQEGVSMESIAAETGYTTVSSFYRAFSAYYGCTTGAYQLQQKR